MEEITFTSDTEDFTLENINEVIKLTEEFFVVSEDPEQMSASPENIEWVYKNIPECVNGIKYNGKIIGYSFIVPCNKKLMDEFISNKLNGLNPI